MNTLPSPIKSDIDICADKSIVIKLYASDAARAIVRCRSITPIYDTACTSAYYQGVTEVYGVTFAGHTKAN